MQIAVLGTGTVGRTLGTALVAAGHTVVMGAREAGNSTAAAWAEAAGKGARTGTFADAAEGAHLIFLCARGEYAAAVLEAAGREHLKGKTVVDVTNPLDFSKGMPPTLFVSNTDSLAEQLQRAFPEAHIVKSLNTLTADLMLAPTRLPEPTAVFVSGNDAAAKAEVSALLASFGWAQIVDLGDITTARGTESWLALWIRLWGALGTPHFNLKLVKQG